MHTHVSRLATVPGGSALRFLLVTTFLLLFSVTAAPAHAGQYVATNITGGGTATITYPNGQSDTVSLTDLEQYPDPNWAGWISERGGSITYHFTATFEYWWEPDEGYTLEDDPPIAESDDIDDTATLNWIGNSSFGFEPASAEGSWNLTVTSPGGTSSASWQATMESVPDGSGGEIITPGGIWGAVPGQLSYTLSGQNPTVTLDFTGEVSATGPSGCYLQLQAGLPRAHGPLYKNCWLKIQNVSWNGSTFNPPYPNVPLTADVDVNFKWGSGNAPNGTPFFKELWRYAPPGTPGDAGWANLTGVVSLGAAVTPPGGSAGSIQWSGQNHSQATTYTLQVFLLSKDANGKAHREAGDKVSLTVRNF